MKWIFWHESNSGLVECVHYEAEGAALRIARAEAEHRGLTPSADGKSFTDEIGTVRVAVYPVPEES